MYYAKDYKNNSNSNANLNNRYRNKYESEQFDSSQNNPKNQRYPDNYRNYQRGKHLRLIELINFIYIKIFHFKRISKRLQYYKFVLHKYELIV